MQDSTDEHIRLTALQDSILGALIERTRFSLFELCHGYRRLRSIDKLMLATETARIARRPLEHIIDEMVH